jgi:hypothetical protein
MAFKFNYLICRIVSGSGFIVAIQMVVTALAADLPSGFGIASKHPGDVGIESEPDVLIAEDFEKGDLADLENLWDNVSNKNKKVLFLINDSPPGTCGKKSLQMSAVLGENTGGHLYKRLPREVEKVYARFYVKFLDPAAYVHHFVHLGGYNPSTPWPQGGAGERPRGDERITVGIEPYGDHGKYKPPGIWNFYCYWWQMAGSSDGKYWGNSIAPETPQVIQLNKWQCVEVMLKLNSTPQSADGELALWIDGEPKLYVKKGVLRSKWTGMGFKVVENNGEEFEGFRWRKNNNLKINFFWLLHYVTDNVYRQNFVSNPPRTNSVVFDNIVVATDYIGPVKAVSSDSK